MNSIVANSIWMSVIALEVLILVRGVRAKLFSRYPVFYSYLLIVFVGELLRFAAYFWRPEIFPRIYWFTEFADLLLGAALMFEVFRLALAAHPGTARMARNGLAFVFALLFAQVLVSLSRGGNLGWYSGAPVEFERNLRVIQACCLIVLMILLLLYSIPIEKNLKGILWGYGLLIAFSVFQLTLVALLWDRVQQLWSYASPLSFFLVLGIWTKTLWSSQPSLAAAGVPTPADYADLHASTRRRFQDFSEDIRRTVRP